MRQTTKPTTVEYVFQNHLTGTSVTSNSSGASVAVRTYNPFDGTQDIQFTGQRLDQTGLYFCTARYYDAGIEESPSIHSGARRKSGSPDSRPDDEGDVGRCVPRVQVREGPAFLGGLFDARRGVASALSGQHLHAGGRLSPMFLDTVSPAVILDVGQLVVLRTDGRRLWMHSYN